MDSHESIDNNRSVCSFLKNIFTFSNALHEWQKMIEEIPGKSQRKY